MTSTQHQYEKDGKGSIDDYVAHLEDALLQACEMILIKWQAYHDKNTPQSTTVIGLFEHFMSISEMEPKTDESPLFLKYKDRFKGEYYG